MKFRFPNPSLETMDRWLFADQAARPTYISGNHTQRASVSFFEYFCDWGQSRQADAIAAGPGGRLFFVEPFIEKVSMGKLLEQLNAGTCTRLPPKNWTRANPHFKQNDTVINSPLPISNRKMGICILAVSLSHRTTIHQNLVPLGEMFQVTSHGSPKH